MNTKPMIKTRLFATHRVVMLLSFLILLINPVSSIEALARQMDAPSWTPPVNLSRSGSTSSPFIVADATGMIHVIWTDEFAGSMYASFSNGSWSSSVQLDFPFDDFSPVFVAGDKSIYAFWINTEKDNSLFYAWAPSADFGLSGSWTAPRLLTKWVGQFDVKFLAGEAESLGQLHLAYIYTAEEERSSGIYYQRSDDAGLNWLPVNEIYLSRYFRPITPETGSIHISPTRAGQSESIFVSWDDRAIGRVFLANSTDQGVTWSTPYEVDGPSVSAASDGPYNLMVNAYDSEILLIWQSNLQSGLTCVHHSQSSNDSGRTWGERKIILEGLIGCAQEIKTFPISGGVLTQVIFQDEVYLFVWNGTSWSIPEGQSTLATFTDPDTDQAVRFRSRQSALTQAGEMFVVGSDELGSLDVWATSRFIPAISDWYPKDSIWGTPIPVAESSAMIQQVQGVMDPNGRFHIFWVADDPNTETNPQKTIYYSIWDQANISIPAQILASPDMDVDKISAVYDPNRNRLEVVWNDTATGLVYFSWADINRSGRLFEWAEPIQLPILNPLAQTPDILAAPDGTILIAYSIPINEGRGIYLLSSSDGGVTWSEPYQVFDAAQQNWQAVEHPQLAQSGDGSLHLLWTQNKIFGAEKAIGLYYARSSDGGVQWSSPQPIEASPAGSGWISGTDRGDVFRFWLQSADSSSANADQASLLFDMSVNNGESWSAFQNLSGLGETPGFVAAVSDGSNQISLLQLIQHTQGEVLLTNHVLKEDQWLTQEGLEPGITNLSDVLGFAAGLSPEGRLAAVYAYTQASEAETGDTHRLMLVAQKDETGAVEPAEPTPVAPATTPGQPTQPAPDTTSASPLPADLPTEAVTEQAPLITVPPSETAAPPINPQTEASTLSPVIAALLGGALSLIVVVIFFIYQRVKHT